MSANWTWYKTCLLCLVILCVGSVVVYQFGLGYTITGDASSDPALFRQLSGLETLRFGSEPYVYQLRNSSTILTGLPFPVLACTETKPSHFIDINKYDLSNFTIITGSSSNHFKESKDLVAGLQKFFPDKKIYYYDIGLRGHQVRQLKSWCNVIVRKFDFSIYPAHVRNLHSYAFKPLILHEVLHEFDAVFWMDSSGRLARTQNKTHWDSVYQTVRYTDGVAQFDNTGRDIFQCTQGGMYRYLPGIEEELKTYEMVGANLVLLYRTHSVYTKIIHWLRLCALTRECIIPDGHRLSCGSTGTPGVAKCHRYDQSALNILIANMHNYADIRMPPVGRVVEVHRQATEFFPLQANCAIFR